MYVPRRMLFRDWTEYDREAESGGIAERDESLG
jgi:hypothetical protein